MTTDHRRTVAHTCLLVAISLLFTWPVLIHGLPDLSADGIDHARWTRNFSSQFWQGEWYPRWISGTNGGLGSPALFFYPSLVSYGVASLFRPLLISHDPNGWLIAGWSAAVAGILAAFAAYFWLRDLTNANAALFGSVVYIFCPYHIAIDLYNRGAISEFWAFVWMPLILLGVSRCVRGGWWAIPGLALSYGFLVVTHLPTVVCFSWIVPLAVWFMSERGRRMGAFIRTFAGILLGIGLAAVFLLPALLDQHKAWIADLVNSDMWFYYRNNFLFIKLVSLLEYRVRILIVVLTMSACVALFYWIMRRFEVDPRRRSLATLYAIAGAISLLMMTHVSIPVYEVFKFVQTIQFPSRFGTALSIALAALSALAFPLLKKQSRLVLAALAILGLGWIAADAWGGSTAFSAWRRIPEERASLYRKQIELQVENYQFWPKPADTLRLSETPALQAFLTAHPARSLVLDPAGGTATIASWRPRRIAIQVHQPEAGRLTVGHFYYRDWYAHLAGSGQGAVVAPSPEGLLQVETPQGDYMLILELIRDVPEQAGIWISSASLLLIGGLWILGRMRLTAYSR
jgi:hypothetical protein